MLLRTPTDEVRQVTDAIPDELLEQVTRGIVDTDPALLEIFPDACTVIFDAAKRRQVI